MRIIRTSRRYGKTTEVNAARLSVTMYQTAYFANYGRRPSKVHLLKENKPVCGSRPISQKQICAHGMVIEYIDCEGCKKWMKKKGILR